MKTKIRKPLRVFNTIKEKKYKKEGKNVRDVVEISEDNKRLRMYSEINGKIEGLKTTVVSEDVYLRIFKNGLRNGLTIKYFGVDEFYTPDYDGEYSFNDIGVYACEYENDEPDGMEFERTEDIFRTSYWVGLNKPKLSILQNRDEFRKDVSTIIEIKGKKFSDEVTLEEGNVCQDINIKGVKYHFDSDDIRRTQIEGRMYLYEMYEDGVKNGPYWIKQGKKILEQGTYINGKKRMFRKVAEKRGIHIYDLENNGEYFISHKPEIIDIKNNITYTWREKFDLKYFKYKDYDRGLIVETKELVNECQEGIDEIKKIFDKAIKESKKK